MENVNTIDNTKTSVIKERNSGFELMRIISMILIVVWHILMHGYVLERTSGNLHTFLSFVQMLCSVHVNSFVLVSGYFQCKAKFNTNKVISLLLSSWCYRIIITSLLLIFGVVMLSMHEIVNNVLLFTGNGYWFLTNYILLYIFSPFINMFINKINKKQYKCLLLILFLLGAVLGNINYWSDYSFLGNGFNLLHFIFLYLIGGYFRYYPLNIKKIFEDRNKYFKYFTMIFIYFFFICINFILSHIATYLMGCNGELANIGLKINSIILNYSNPFIIIASIFYFLFFSLLNFKNKIVNYISKYTLDVYMIHDNTVIRPIIYVVLGFNQMYYYSFFTVIKILLVTIFIYIVATGCGILKDYLFKWLSKFKFNKWIDKRISIINNKYNKLFSEDNNYHF